MHFHTRTRLIAIAAAVALQLVAFPTSAQTLLRWKLQTGQRLVADISQKTQSQVDFGGKSAVTKLDLTMRVDWHVVDAVEDAIRVQQTIEQIRATLTTPGASADFDSGA